MSAQIGKHMSTIRKQRAILDDWTAYEHDLDRFWERPSVTVIYDFETMVAQYHHNLDVAEVRLKTAAAKGGVVDITDTELGHDLRLVCDPKFSPQNKGDKLRARANLIRLDFYERFGRLVDARTYKLTIPHIAAPVPDAPIADLALALQVPKYQPVVLVSFEDPADAMLYRLAIQ